MSSAKNEESRSKPKGGPGRKKPPGRFVRGYRRYHAWRAPFPVGWRIVCDAVFWLLVAAGAYMAVTTACAAALMVLPLLMIFGLGSGKTSSHDDGIDWDDHRMGGQPKGGPVKF